MWISSLPPHLISGRQWRAQICNRLQQAGLVEVFESEVDNDAAQTKKKRKRKTPVSCLRLLKSFSHTLFEPKTLESGHDEIDSEQLTSVRRGQCEQLLELPIEHQIFYMVDAEGSKGLVVFELCRRLGISNKKNRKRIDDMSSRFGLHQLTEIHKKGTAYKCWTPRNFQPQQLKSLSKRPEDVYGENENISPLQQPTSLDESPETIPGVDCSVPQSEQGCTSCLQEVGGCDRSNTAADYSLVEVVGSNGTLVEKSACTLPKPMKIQSHQRSPSLTCTRREHKILERLKGTHGTISVTPREFEQSCTREEMTSCRMTSHHRLPKRLAKRWEERLNVLREAHTSVAVANAIELFKIVYLSTSTSAEVPNPLAETLRCYSEHDLLSAFDYLRQKRIMVRSRGSHPYVLSEHFLQGLSLSQFPTNTGKRADKLAGWIREREKDLMEGVVSLSADLQCGDIFHLAALVSCGEMTISPHLPDEGVCEAEDPRNLKCGSADTEIDSTNKKQKLLSQESEICSRREKGFPGIQVLLNRTTISRPDIVEFFRDDGIHSLLSSETNQFYTMLGKQIHSNIFDIDCMKEAPDFGSIATEAVASGESQWELMANFTKKALRLSDEEQQKWISPSLFQSITIAIQEAGDQGLSMLEVSELVCMQGKSKAEDIIDVLHAFGMAYKVNGYDSFHVVDPSRRSKYFLISKDCRSEDTPISTASIISQRIAQEYDDSEARKPGEVKNVDVHKVTLLNLSENANTLSDAIDHGDENEHIDASSSNLQPVVPWMSGDGTVNVIVYKGLRRRILGIVMQSPGILKDDVISQMDVINPQSCKKLLELMMLDNHISVRKMHQMTSFAPPSLLKSLCKSQVGNPKFVFREHLFANPISASLL